MLHLLLIKGGMKTENGKVNQRSTPEGAEVKTENYPPPPPSLVAPVSGGQLAGMRGERMSGEWFIHPLPLRGLPLSQGEKVGDSVNCCNHSPPYREGLGEGLFPSHRGRARPSEEALNVLLCLGRGALPSATRGLVGEGSPFN